MLKPELQAKFLNHLSNRKKNKEEGFTLIELLVVVIIIGVLAAIALPSLLGQVNKAKQAEAKNNIGTANRAQQAFYLEYQKFATDVDELQLGIKTQTENFKYSIDGGSGGPIQVNGQNIKNGLKAYYGLVGTVASTSSTGEALTLAIACESKAPLTANPSMPSVPGAFAANTACDPAYTSLAR
ncbi:MAG TPA: type IV pilin-like G/H family protein [Nostocaceae cyanobacterium]|nr:type IV pilin-like G/H family protein [Nostocaceae cyanobacterium]